MPGGDPTAPVSIDHGGVPRGTLRIYLGAAPGVGKTFAMLGEAHRRLSRGTDIVVGLVETHGRRRTAEQLEAERARVLGELRGQVAALAVDAAERVVRANLDQEANRRLVEDYIRNLGTVGNGSGRV